MTEPITEKAKDAPEGAQLDSVSEAVPSVSESKVASPASESKEAPPALKPKAKFAEMPSCCARHKDTPRSGQFQDDLQKRLNRAIGQLNGVKAMLDDNRYCGDVLMQLAAAESAVRNVSYRILHNHLETCVVEQIQQGNTEVVDEAMQLIKRFGR